jgi:hypothetical protein
MIPTPVETLRAFLDEARTAVRSGQLAGLKGPEHDIAAIVEQVQHDAIGAAPERIAELAERLGQSLQKARQAVKSGAAETRRRLVEMIVETYGQQERSGPGLAAALRRARRDVLSALVDTGGQVGLKDLVRLRSELESRAIAAAPSRATGPETLSAWIETVGALLEQMEADRLPVSPAWREVLEEGREAGASAPSRSRSACAAKLADASLQMEAALLVRQAAARQEHEEARREAFDLLLGGELRQEERAPLEGLLVMETSGEGLVAAVRRVREILRARQARARARLEAALGTAEACGLAASDVQPVAEPVIQSLRGAARLRAGAAWVESLVANHEFRPLEARVMAAIQKGWGRYLPLGPGPEKDTLLAALADLKVRTAGEGPGAVAEALQALERLLAGPAPQGGAARRTQSTLSPEDLAALEAGHPSAAAAWRALVEAAGASGPEEVLDLSEQAALEAQTLREMQESVRR